MGWFSKLFAGGASNLIEKVGNTVDKFHLSGEEKQQFKLELQTLIQQRESEVEQTIRKNLEAKERILVAELQQGDTYTKRARPTVVYFGLIMIGLNYFLLPAILLVMGKSDMMLAHCDRSPDTSQQVCERQTLFPLPDEFWVAWGGIVATWAVGRSFEKSGSNNRIVRGVTGSSKRSSLLDEDDAVG